LANLDPTATDPVRRCEVWALVLSEAHIHCLPRPETPQEAHRAIFCASVGKLPCLSLYGAL
jgi:hypothetical protein